MRHMHPERPRETPIWSPEASNSRYPALLASPCFLGSVSGFDFSGPPGQNHGSAVGSAVQCGPGLNGDAIQRELRWMGPMKEVPEKLG
jgi:hypothetical protein